MQNTKHSQGKMSPLKALEGESVTFHSTECNLFLGDAGATSRDSPEPASDNNEQLLNLYCIIYNVDSLQFILAINKIHV